MAAEPDWESFDERLRAATVAAVGRFAREHADEPVCFVGFDADPRGGTVLIAFDTPAHSVEAAEALQRFLVEDRRRSLVHPHSWRAAKYHMTLGGLQPYMTEPAMFKFPDFARVEFPEWPAIAAAEGPRPNAAHVEGYLVGNARLLLWRVTERLVADDALAPLKPASPFAVCYSVRGEETAVLRVLRWPVAGAVGGRN